MLTDRKIKLAILTGGGPKIYTFLKHHALDTYFSSVVHHERVVHPKPDPEGFLLACKECGVNPEEAIMVDDTMFDIGAGKRANAFATIAVTHGFGSTEELKLSGADYIAKDMDEVNSILNKLAVEA